MVLALIVAMNVKSIDVKRFVLLATVVVGLSALAPYWTGEPAEEMPPLSYRLMHPSAKLSEVEKEKVKTWVKESLEKP